MFWSLLALVALAWPTWTVYSLIINYRLARCIQVPILMSPVSVHNTFWIIFQDVLIDYFIKWLPFGLGSWVRYSTRGWLWSFKDRGRIHQEYGPIIAHVTPEDIHVWINDKDVTNGILIGRGRGQFEKPRKLTKSLDFIGQNVISAGPETWKRQRRIVTTPFNQRNNRIVWAESLQQGILLGQHWFENSKDGVRSIWVDNERSAMNVMISAGFGLPRENHKSFSDTRHRTYDFHSSLSSIVTQYIFLLMLPSKLWFPKILPPFPESLRDFFKSIRAFKEHLDEMIASSKASANENKADTSRSSYTARLASDNLLTALVMHSEDVRKADAGSGKALRERNSLTDDEIYANLFGFAFAGHETTAHTLSYATFTLAAESSVQYWVAEEISAVHAAHPIIESWDMDEIYPQLKRTRALMFEVLRYFSPLSNVIREVHPPEGATIQIGPPSNTRTLRFPPKALVLPMAYALHFNEEYWGRDALDFNPKRFIEVDDEGIEQFKHPEEGTFIAWSHGARNCPGARFSQVEFVAVCAALLSTYRITPVRAEGEDQEAAAQRIRDELGDPTSAVTLMIKNSEKLPLRLERLPPSVK